MSKILFVVTLPGLMILGTAGVSSQDYPNKPIRVVTANAGGGNDFMTRLLMPQVSVSLGKPVIVDNRGGGGIVTAELVSRAPPDGYTLLAHSNSIWTGPLLQKTPYDAVTDLAPIVMVARAPYILVVHPSVAANSVKDLIALAKGKPGELNYASGPTGGGSHLSAELLKHMAGVDIVRIAYKGGLAALTDVLAGRVQMTFDDVPTLMPNVKLGKLRALAVTTAEPSSLAPGLPTVAASGLPGYISEAMQGVFAPARTPRAIINRLNQELVRVIKLPDVNAKLLNSGVEPVGSSPEQFLAAVKADVSRLAKVIKDAGIKSE